MELPLPMHGAPIEHPIQRIQTGEAERAQEMHQIRACYGRPLAAEMAVERTILASIGRQSGLRSSHALLDHYNGTLTSIDTKDIYGLPQYNPRLPRAPRKVAQDEMFGEQLVPADVKDVQQFIAKP